MKDRGGHRLDRFEVADAQQKAERFARNDRALTPTLDTAVVDIDHTPDASWTRSYARGTNPVIPATWPVDTGRTTETLTGAFSIQASPAPLGQRLNRMMIDGDRLLFYCSAAAGHGLSFYVDGSPLQIAPHLFVATKAQYVRAVFAAGKKTRLIEILGDIGLHSVFVPKPAKIWKPPPISDPCVVCVGNSFNAPAVFENTGTAVSPVTMYGAIQGLAPQIGVKEIMIDAGSGSGFLTNGGGIHPPYTDASRRAILTALNPDVIMVFGGEMNDKLATQTNAAIIAAATAYYTSLRAEFPNAKLVHIEGFAPPIFLGYQADFVAISAALRAALTDVGVYYVDVATTDPWINGTGYVNHTPGTENSGIYIGDDGSHPTILGHEYVRNRFAPIMRRILRDRGELLNTLIR